jgi:hypothetical protein
MKFSGSSSLLLLSTASLVAASNDLKPREPINIPGISELTSVVGDVTSAAVGAVETLTSDVVSVVTTVIEPEFTTLTSEVYPLHEKA